VLWLNPRLKLGVGIDYPKPKSIGADRLANAAAVTALAQEHGVPIHRGGTVGERGGRVRLRLRDATIDRPVGELREVYFTAIPRRLGD